MQGHIAIDKAILPEGTPGLACNATLNET